VGVTQREGPSLKKGKDGLWPSLKKGKDGQSREHLT